MDNQNIIILARLCTDFIDYTTMLSASLDNAELKQKIIGKLDVIQKEMLKVIPQENKTKHYLLTTIGDIEPELSGPFETEADRLTASMSHRQNDPDKEDGLFKLDILNGDPQVSTYCGGELEDLS